MTQGPAFRFTSIALAIAIWALFGVGQAQAQIDQTPGSASAGEVEVGVEQFGVGNQARPGEWTGIRLALTDRGSRVRSAIARIRLRDADGDLALIGRSVTLNPGRRQPLWLYFRLPHDADPSSIFEIEVRETTDGATGQRVGRRIGMAWIQPVSLVSSTDPMIGVIGRQDAGLKTYSIQSPGNSWSPTGHELIRVISDLSPETLPDTWMGLAQFESIFWSGDRLTNLGSDAASALNEWVLRGGHLVISLPSTGGAWLSERSNPLSRLMPSVTARRLEGVDLGDFRRILTDSPLRRLPDDAIVHVFEASPDAAPHEARVILQGPAYENIVVRRLHGAGAVTLIGLDLGDARLTGRIDAQEFWHRMLGKRFDVLSLPEMQDLQANGGADFRTRSAPYYLDINIPGAISMKGKAGAGVLLALVIFIAYWALAGPISFSALKLRDLQQHAWVVFVAITGIFTAIAWGGATILKPSETDARHLTLLDAVHGQAETRTRTWISILLPTYGEQEVRVGGDSAVDDWRDALSSWENPSSTVRRRFPDPREYTISSTRPNTARVPTRSTVKQFQVDWLGGSRWRLPRAVDDDIWIDDDGRLHGQLVHELPGELRNVEIVLVKGLKPYTELRHGGPMLAESYAWKLRAWPAESLLVLDDLGETSRQTQGEALYRDLARRRVGWDFAGDAAFDMSDAPRNFQSLAWASVLEPPDWTTYDGQKVMLQRRAAHGWDLGRWFTEPCLIIVGQVSDADTPTPLFVDGEPLKAEGRTIVRWVFPLKPQPLTPARQTRGTVPDDVDD